MRVYGCRRGGTQQARNKSINPQTLFFGKEKEYLLTFNINTLITGVT